MSPFYPLNCSIQEAFKIRQISLAENGGGTEAAEQIQTVTGDTDF